MSTMQQAPSAEPGAVPDAQDMSAAVEEQMGKIVTELGAALGVLLTSLGTRSGLWAALAGAGPLTTAEVAAKVSVEPSLVREWLRAQAAGGYLDYDPATGTFTLPDAVAAAICHGPGGALVDAAATMFSSMGEGFAAFSEAFSTGQGFGWHQRTADHWHGTDAFTRVALPTGLIAAAIGEMADVAAALAAGGSVADVGCGYGTPTMAIAESVPGGHGSSASTTTTPRSPTARAEAARRGVGNVRFEVARRGRPARPGLRPDHLLRLPARHRRPARRADPGPGGAGPGRSGAPGRADGSRRRRGQPQPGRAHVLRRIDPGLHAERGVPENGHVIRAARPGRAAAAAGRGGRAPGSAASAGSMSRPR